MTPVPHPRSKTIGVGIVGMGFMGRTHARAYLAASAAGWPCELCAACDTGSGGATVSASATQPSVSQVRTGTAQGSLGPDPAPDPFHGVRRVRCADELFADPNVRLVSICTPTDSHTQLASRALLAGKHVLVEKPISLRADEVRTLASLAHASGGLCMPAMCVRFWPGWDWLALRVRDRSLGSLRSIGFDRHGASPDWNPGFYLDPDRSGGALYDLHVHDVDFLCWCFGKPARVTATGALDSVSALYKFTDGTSPDTVSASAGWRATRGAGFRMRYTAYFEHATADFDSARTPPLRVAYQDHVEDIATGHLTGYDGQVRHFVDIIARGGRDADLHATLTHAADVLDVLDAEKESMTAGRWVALSGR